MADIASGIEVRLTSNWCANSVPFSIHLCCFLFSRALAVLVAPSYKVILYMCIWFLFWSSLGHRICGFLSTVLKDCRLKP
jgi:hypothetical protein